MIRVPRLVVEFWHKVAWNTEIYLQCLAMSDSLKRAAPTTQAEPAKKRQQGHCKCLACGAQSKDWGTNSLGFCV
eukprot:5642098-Amphidinium_carterae.1